MKVISFFFYLLGAIFIFSISSSVNVESNQFSIQINIFYVFGGLIFMFLFKQFSGFIISKNKNKIYGYNNRIQYAENRVYYYLKLLEEAENKLKELLRYYKMENNLDSDFGNGKDPIVLLESFPDLKGNDNIGVLIYQTRKLRLQFFRAEKEYVKILKEYNEYVSKSFISIFLNFKKIEYVDRTIGVFPVANK